MSSGGGSGGLAAGLRSLPCSFRRAMLRFRALASRSLRSSEVVFLPVMFRFSALTRLASSDGVAPARRLWHVSARAKRKVRCRSSVVEHSLGKGEVGSSILPGSTIQGQVEDVVHGERRRRGAAVVHAAHLRGVLPQTAEQSAHQAGLAFAATIRDMARWRSVAADAMNGGHAAVRCMLMYALCEQITP